MHPDTLVVIAKSSTGSASLLPLWTGLLGGALGIVGTVVASITGRRNASDQINAQQLIATRQLEAQAAAGDRQIRATVVSANRMRWIDQLRVEIAAFLAAILDVATDLAGTPPIDRGAIALKIDKTNHHAAVIELLVNHDEPESRQLCALLHETMDLVGSALKFKDERTVLPEAVEQKMYAIRDSTRGILKAEWERVKKIE
jgi:hypothetical protein